MNSLLSSFLGNTVYISKALGVKEYAYCDEMNPSFRNTMEDGTLIFPYKFDSEMNRTFYC